jgi:UDP-N-acetyl-D-mannosaminuronic acid dehydrogenase
MRRVIEQISGLRVGSDFDFAYCPERLAEGAAKTVLVTLPQVIGADDPKSAQAPAGLFAQLGLRILPRHCVRRR